MFDAPEYCKAFEPPTFVDLDGTKHVGRLIGAHTWFKMQPDLRIANEDGTPNHLEIERTALRLVRTMFPPPWWAPWRRDLVVRKVWRLPPLIRTKAIMDFLHSQDQWIRGRLDPRPGSSQASSPSSDAPGDPSPASATAGA